MIVETRQKSNDFAIVSLLHRNNFVARRIAQIRRTQSINPPLSIFSNNVFFKASASKGKKLNQKN
jgi:hypothetical protein